MSVFLLGADFAAVSFGTGRILERERALLPLSPDLDENFNTVVFLISLCSDGVCTESDPSLAVTVAVAFPYPARTDPAVFSPPACVDSRRSLAAALETLTLTAVVLWGSFSADAADFGPPTMQLRLSMK